ncbi:hypothetical protein WJX72_009686 [[Myrmecia] bisecta]|uniref:N-acetyltransferase domain-containing protein n=1 Tax=[Myrmecia] bisecta TaxID=41462 RepID=A0AAW1PBP4_9CHLO
MASLSTELPAALPSLAPSQCWGVRPATRSDYWAIADVHCGVFYPEAHIMGCLLRMDRVFALQMGEHFEKLDNEERFCCLMADAEPAAIDPLAPLSRGLGLTPWVKRVLPAALQDGFGSDAVSGGAVGSVVIDTLAEHIPPRRVVLPGQVGFTRRRGLAYLSNLAVVATARRSGVARRLLREAERVAFTDWGCRALALHVDPDNTPACALYKNAGYRVAAAEPRWVPWLQGRPNVRLVLMMKVAPRRKR